MSLVKSMKQNDLLPTLDVELTYKDRDLLLDITPGTTCVFSMYPVGSSTAKISRQPATVVSSVGGTVLVRYSWAAGDTNTIGDFEGEFELTLTGKPLSAPTNGRLLVRILDDLA